MLFLHNFSRSQGGFSLIELVTVIAIIGTLSKITLGSYTTARNKGNDAVIKLDFNQLRSQAVNYYDTNGNYGVGLYGANSPWVCTDVGTGSTNKIPPTSFFGSTIANQFITQINTKQNNTGITGNGSSGPQCITDTDGRANATMWAIAATLSDGTVMCLDSTGVIKASSTVSSLSYYPSVGAGAAFGVSPYTASCK
ncbi:prepilin-type N-terminal cleavage/methylation domain-containing protein [bacterium]|nr:prepilin-type N-terminal cleavage/methylation domain-containing protein [bacterium]